MCVSLLLSENLRSETTVEFNSEKIRLIGQVSIVQTTWVCSGNTALNITLPLQLAPNPRL